MADEKSNKASGAGTLEDPAHPTAPSRVAGATPHDADELGKAGVRQPKGGVAEAGDGATGTVEPGEVDPSGGAQSGGVA
jgi:hypothetical protein